MKLCSTLVMVVYYEQAEKYTPDYLNSISNQTTTEFDLLIISDNIKPIEPVGLKVKIHHLTISTKMTPSRIRYEGIQFAIKQKYDNLIFSDIDDYFSSNRVALSIKELKKCVYVFNSLTPVTENKKIIRVNDLTRKMSTKDIFTHKPLLEYNTLGLTHTGINLESIDQIEIPEEILATDWWLFTTLSLKGYIGKYIPDATTYYRQSEDNMVGMQKLLDENRLLLGVKVKKIHYKYLIEFCRQQNLMDILKEYADRSNEIHELSVALQDNAFRTRYVATINRNYSKIYKGWWSDIVTLKQWRMYEN